MPKTPGTYQLFGWFLLLLFCISACKPKEKRKFTEESDTDTLSYFDRVVQKGSITAITDYNSTNYFIYRGEPMGYQYELLKMLCEDLNLEVDLKIEQDMKKAFNALENEQCDIIAMGLTITKKRSEEIGFTNPIGQTRQVLVQRKPQDWRKMRTWDELEEKLIRNPLELAGKKIHVQRNTTFYNRLVNLSDEIGDTIFVIEDDRTVEQLIREVAEGNIDYTVCDEHIALVNRRFYPDLDVETTVSFHQNIAWAVKQGNDVLLDTINYWLDSVTKTRTFAHVYNKYFRNPNYVHITSSEFHSVTGGKISQYDPIIKKYSKIIGWDWRLLASLIYQESRFDPSVRSWAGAFGLMQLMPHNAAKFGIDSLSSPEDQIRAGVRFILLLEEQLKDIVPEPGERIKFILASYNAGIAHVYDARRLAEKHLKDPGVWTNNVDSFLLRKADPEFYNDPVVKYGYCRGDEPFKFVSEILDRYGHYQKVID